MFGKKNTLFQLLQASADASRDAAHAVHQLMQGGGATAPCMATFKAARHCGKALASQISEELVNTFVTRLDREDIEAINAALVRIPKAVEKFASRHALVAQRLRGVDFSARTQILAACTDVVADMVGALHQSLHIEPMRKLQARLQALEGEADMLLLECYGGIYLHEADPIRVVLAKDLFETLEKAIDGCRDVGNVIYTTVLKNN